MWLVWCLLVIITLPMTALAGQTDDGVATARLTELRVTGQDEVTRIEIMMSAAATYHAALNDERRRLVIDFDNTTYDWRGGAIPVATGPVRELRGSQYSRSVSRVVVEFTRDVSYSIREAPDGLWVIVRTSGPAGETSAEAEASAKLAQTDAGVADTADTPRPDSEKAEPPSRDDPYRLSGPIALVDAPSLSLSSTPEPALAAPKTDRRARADSKDPLDLERLKRSLARMEAEPAAQSPATPEASALPFEGRRGPAMAVTLQDAIDLALKENLGLRSTSLSSESIALEIPKARARFHPTVGFTLSGSGVRAAPEGARRTTLTTYQLAPLAIQQLPTGGALVLSSDFAAAETHPATPSLEYSSAVTLSLVQPLLRGGRIYVATQPIRNAEFDSRIADNGLKAQVLSVTAGTKTAYYSVLLAEKVIGVTEAAIARDQELVDASNALFQARLVTKRDVFSAELSFAQDSARLVSARADLETAKNALLSVLGLPIATDVVLVDKEISFEPIQLELERLIATGTEKRPEILAAQERLAKAALNIRVSRNALLPQLDLVASYGRAHTRTVFARSLDLAGDVWTAGLVFSFPIGNVAARATLSQAEIDYKNLLVQLEQTKRDVELGVRAAVIKLRKSVERIKALTVAIEQAKGKLEVGKAQFALGLATNLDITDAQLAILNAETDLLTAIVDYNIGLAELEASIAGPLRMD